VKRAVLLLLGAVVPVAHAAAQGPDEVRAELQRAQRDLQQMRSDGDALLDARIRYDLGLPPREDLATMRGDAPPTTPVAVERAQRELADADAATASLLGRFQKLRQQVEQLRAEAQQRAAAQPKDEEWITVPVPGSAAPRHAPRDGGPAGSQPAGSQPAGSQPAGSQPDAEPGARPDGEGAAAPLRVVANLEPIKAQINGTDDHGLVAHALFKAGQALMDRADALRAQGHGDAADQADGEARQRLQRALDELQPVTTLATPAFADLFCLGKCRELLFRIAERRDGLSLRSDPKEYQRREQDVRDPFVAITARDVVVHAGNEQPGPWGRAAQAAMDHFRWMNLHAGYAPKTDPKSITWTTPPQR